MTAKTDCKFRTVEVARTEQDRVLVRSGLEPGERVCIDNLAAAINEMGVDVLGDEEKAPGEESAAEVEPES